MAAQERYTLGLDFGEGIWPAFPSSAVAKKMAALVLVNMREVSVWLACRPVRVRRKWRRLSTSPNVMAGLEPAIHLTMRKGYVYILASGKNGTLYIGVTNDLSLRVWNHKEGRASRFTRRYGVTRLVWYEEYPIVPLAIQRETSLKRWKREWKIALIEKMNPNWDDLSAGLV